MKAALKLRGLAVMGFLLAGSVLVQASSATVNLSPLEDQVRHRIVMLPYFNVFDNISFRTDGGAVTLFGQVTEPYVKRDAESAVRGIEGVKQVDNQIEVLPLSMFDNQIRRQTYFAVYGFGPLERYGMGTQPSIRIIVKNGNVSLEGVVNSEADRNLAYLRANRVPGVFSVTNDLRVEK